jgi:hypothetical protein
MIQVGTGLKLRFTVSVGAPGHSNGWITGIQGSDTYDSSIPVDPTIDSCTNDKLVLLIVLHVAVLHHKLLYLVMVVVVMYSQWWYSYQSCWWWYRCYLS